MYSLVQNYKIQLTKMIIEKLCTPAEKESAVQGWTGNGVARSGIMFILDEMLSGDSEWNVIIAGGTNIAVFDVRHVPAGNPNYHKALRIYFAPSLNPDDGQSVEEVEEMIDKVVKSLAYAFKYMLEGAKETNEQLVKIYSQHPHMLSIFREFVLYLTQNYPNLYKGKFYGKWVEIQHI
jgi:hypothetical protein